METGEKILFKAFELFKRYGVRSVTMDEIAGQSGVSKKTVYQYFEDKDTLVEKIIEDVIVKSEEHCTAQTAKSENAIHEIFLCTAFLEEMIEGVNPAMMNDLRKYHNVAYAKIEAHNQHYLYAYVKNNIERGMAEGVYRSDIKLEIITPFYLHCMTIALEQDIFPKSKFTIADINFEIALFTLNGLSTSKGVKLVDKYKQQRIKLNTL